MKNVPTKTIAIVEDDDKLLYAINKKLTNNNLSTLLFSSKKNFFELINTAKRPHIDLFWLDFYLGDGDAFELVDKIKSVSEYANVPIIIVSNSMDENRVKYMLSLGIKRYFLKAGTSLQELVEEVVKYTKEV